MVGKFKAFLAQDAVYPKLPNPKDYGENMVEQGVESENQFRDLARQGLGNDIPDEWMRKALAAFKAYKAKYPD